MFQQPAKVGEDDDGGGGGGGRKRRVGKFTQEYSFGEYVAGSERENVKLRQIDDVCWRFLREGAGMFEVCNINAA